MYALKKLALHPGKVVDIGCGKGRNAIYLAQRGWQVVALDYIQIALDKAFKDAQGFEVDKNITFINTPIDQRWPLKDNYFDLALDNFSSIDIETKTGRDVYKQEMFRTLKPGGYGVVAVVSAEDELEKEIATISPGSESHSTIWPGSGKFQKNYTVIELNEFYKEFKIIELHKVQKPATKLGKTYNAINYRLILQKPL